MNFLFEEGSQIGLSIDDLDNFLQFGKYENFLRKPCFRVLNGGGRETGIRNENTAHIATTIDTDQMRSNLLAADGRLPLFHFHEVQHAVNFDRAVNLLDDSLSFVSLNGEGFAYKKPREGEEAVQDGLKLLSALVGILLREKFDRDSLMAARCSASFCFACTLAVYVAWRSLRSLSRSNFIRVKLSFTFTSF